MRIFRKLVVTSIFLLLAMAMARAEVVYPRAACRIYVDTDFIHLPNQCGTVVLVWRFRSPYHYYREFVMRTSEPKATLE